MKRYGVLIVDDSAYMRRAIGLLFERDSQFYIVGVARNGIEALEKISRFQPDVVTMDVEMPEMDGIAALERIMKEHPLPVVMLSAHTVEGAKATLQALELGAIDFFLKASLLQENEERGVVDDFLQRVKAAAEGKVRRAGEISAEEAGAGSAPGKTSVGTSAASAASGNEQRNIRGSAKPPVDLVFIGCSTGGPSALQTILPRFPGDFPVPIVVVQHMPPGFTRPLAERFDGLCQLRVKEALSGEELTPGTIYIAPAGFQTIIQRGEGKTDKFLVFSSESDTSLYKPSIDVTLESAAPLFQERILSVILTGMGSDGLEGCRAVKARNGTVLAEAEESCIVYGMPRVVVEAGLADRQVHLSAVYGQIVSYFQ
ncbi:protein-glutamate methylesterase/protein-glutamine glutaminase [Paenibacillus turpanensis]|uniref:protein-glutamate methylesterase/protein-glutamine glutaminase n=1 Tax=Paenibacillus turpanensis TaxID=2689078 RepID=UPI001409B7B7|nr:chemotaxis response regulator protein-glutamate methylesterase [Paenibacillus turpanensis]